MKMIVANTDNLAERGEQATHDEGYIKLQQSLSETYTNEEEGVSFKYPSDWEVLDGTSSIVEMFDTKNTPDHRASLSVNNFWDSDPFGVFTDDTNSIKEAVNEVHTFLSVEDDKIDGIPARLLKYSTKGLNGTDIVWDYYYIAGDDIYCITCSYTESTAETYEALFNAIIESYTITSSAREESQLADAHDSNGFIYNGKPLSGLLGASSDKITDVFGQPTGGTPVTGELLYGGTEYWTYDDTIGFYFDNETVSWIGVRAEMVTFNGITLNMNPSELYDKFGEASYERYIEDEAGEGADYYYMEYILDGTVVGFEMPDANSNSDRITISAYDDEYFEPEPSYEDNPGFYDGVVYINDSFGWVEEPTGSTDSIGLSHIKGIVKNTSDKAYSYVGISFNLYDGSGNQVGTATAAINDLGAGSTWRFDALGSGSGVSRFEFVSIDAF